MTVHHPEPAVFADIPLQDTLKDTIIDAVTPTVDISSYIHDMKSILMGSSTSGGAAGIGPTPSYPTTTIFPPIRPGTCTTEQANQAAILAALTTQNAVLSDLAAAVNKLCALLGAKS